MMKTKIDKFEDCKDWENWIGLEVIKHSKKPFKGGKQIEIVFVSRDRNAEEFKSYFSTMSWKAIPFEDNAREEITSKFGVNGIPALILMDDTGKVISMDGTSLVRNNDESFLGK